MGGDRCARGHASSVDIIAPSAGAAGAAVHRTDRALRVSRLFDCLVCPDSCLTADEPRVETSDAATGSYGDRKEILRFSLSLLASVAVFPVSSLIPANCPGAGDPRWKRMPLLGAQVCECKPEHFQAPARQLTPSAVGRWSSGQLKGPSRHVRIAQDLLRGACTCARVRGDHLKRATRDRARSKRPTGGDHASGSLAVWLSD